MSKLRNITASPSSAPKTISAPTKLGRPSGYTPEIAEDICELIARGISLRAITARADMPGEKTVYQWLAKEADFAQQYERARERQAHLYASEITEIADTASNDDWNVARLRIDARKWFASKVSPKKYGDRVAQEISGPDGEALQVNVSVQAVKAIP